jgi:hypothetical protein
MTKYLISFPSRAMEVADDEWELVGRESHAVVQQAKDAGVRVVGGGIEESVAPGPRRRRRHRHRGRLPRERAALRRVRRPRAPVARRCTGVGGTFRRLLPVPAGPSSSRPSWSTRSASSTSCWCAPGTRVPADGQIVDGSQSSTSRWSRASPGQWPRWWATSCRPAVEPDCRWVGLVERSEG